MWMPFCDPGWKPGLLQPLQRVCSAPASLQDRAGSWWRRCSRSPQGHEKTRRCSRVPAALRKRPGNPTDGGGTVRWVQGGTADGVELMGAQPERQEGHTAASAPSSSLLPRRRGMLGQQCQQARNTLGNGD